MFSLLPCCYLFRLNLALCCTCEWMRPCCSLLWNNIKCHVSLNLETWNTSFQLHKQFLHVILNALCRSRVLTAVQSIVQWPSSVLCILDTRRKDWESLSQKMVETWKCSSGQNMALTPHLLHLQLLLLSNTIIFLLSLRFSHETSSGKGRNVLIPHIFTSFSHGFFKLFSV